MRLLKEIQNLMGNYHLKSGLYHYYRNEYTQAIDFLRKALKDEANLTAADLRNVRYYLTLALLESADRLAEKGETEQGVEQLRKAAEVSPDYPDIHFRLGRVLEELGQDDEAVVEFRAAIETHPDYLEAHLALAFCLLRRGDSTEASAAFREALKTKVDKIESRFRSGMESLEAGEREQAGGHFHDAFLALPQIAHECLRSALVWLKAEEHAKALAELDRAIERNPRYPDLHNFRGVVLCELGRLEEALDAFRLSSRLSPRYLVPRLNLAFALIRLGESRQAEAELESVLRIEPAEPAAKAKLEELRASGGAPEKRRPASRGTGR